MVKMTVTYLTEWDPNRMEIGPISNVDIELIKLKQVDALILIVTSKILIIIILNITCEKQ